MTAPLDLTGLRFGKLVALKLCRVKSGRGWVCHCDCGRETVVAARSLSGVADDDPRAIRACEACRSRRCAICQTPYLIAGSAATCGASECRLEYRRAKNRSWYAQKRVQSPDYHRDLAARRRERLRSDPEAYALYLELMRGYYSRPEVIERKRLYAKRRRRESPEEKRARSRIYYAENREAVRAYVRSWLEAMSPERRAEWDAKARAAEVRCRRRRALAEMLRDSRKLMEMASKNDT